ncbi:MAG: DUF815 domain-containing protein, partial [Rhodospirillales bacterium]|nr:DUF815 domain-containing protein [Rhodospirillales bacterium]
MTDDQLYPLLQRIADSLERLAPAPAAKPDLTASDAYVWHKENEWLEVVPEVNRIELELLQGIEKQRDTLMENTRRFTDGLPANNALLWGARGTGKSSVVKAIHAKINEDKPGALALVEIHREDITSL